MIRREPTVESPLGAVDDIFATVLKDTGCSKDLSQVASLSDIYIYIEIDS